MDNSLIIGAIIIFVILLIVVYKVLSTTTRVVPQEKRLVIYRLGRFHRVVGPGPVQILPSIDKIVQTIEVRDHPLEINVPGIFAFGVPNELKLNLWCSFDLVQAAGGDHDKLAKFVQISEAERRKQVEVKMREAIVRQIADLQEKMPLPDKASLIERVIALAPGSTRYNALLKGLKYELEKSLPSVGVILNTSQPIVLTGRNISDEITEAIKRRRGREIDSEWLTNYVDQLRQRFPGVSNAVLAQMLASIEGVDAGKVQRLLLEKEADTEAEVEFEMPGDGTEAPNVIAKPRTKRRDKVADRQARPAEAEAGSPPPAPKRLTKGDLAVLKRVPRSSPDQRLSA